MANRNCPRTQLRDPERARAEATAAAIIAQGRQAARERLEGTPAPAEDVPMKRYVHTAPCWTGCIPLSGQDPAASARLDRILEAMARQNQLLVDLLGAVNALTAATLSIQSRLGIPE